ncbi:MAG: glycosyltransferase [Phycisphaerae bacterium]|nr:glycosyltransferase [Phycisphaerae bacterium]
MKVAMCPCIVITYPFPLGRATGGARLTREIARHLGKAGAEVIILPVSASPLSRYPRPKVADKFLGFEFDEDLSQYSVDIVRVPQHPLHWRFDGLAVKNALRKTLKERHVKIVLSFFNEAPAPAFLRSRGVKFGYIAIWQSYAIVLTQYSRLGRVRKLVWKWANDRYIIRPHKQADVLFAISHFTRQELMDVIGVEGERITVCHLGVDSIFTKISRPRPVEITQFIYFTRIVPLKGILDAIEALGMLAAKGLKNWNLRVLGLGNHEMVRKAAREHGIGHKVVVCDPVNDERLRRELQQAHLAIMPSHAESFGLALAEAQAAGIPVVSYDVGSVPEVVENGVTGWLAPLHRVDRLAQCIEEAIWHPETTYRAGLAGRERVKQMFTWEKTAATILEGIKKL